MNQKSVKINLSSLMNNLSYLNKYLQNRVRCFARRIIKPKYRTLWRMEKGIHEQILA